MKFYKGGSKIELGRANKLAAVGGGALEGGRHANKLAAVGGGASEGGQLVDDEFDADGAQVLGGGGGSVLEEEGFEDFSEGCGEGGASEGGVE